MNILFDKTSEKFKNSHFVLRLIEEKTSMEYKTILLINSSAGI
jgi:hypothetical protein